MTTDHTQQTPPVRLRCDGAVDEKTLAYARAKVDAVLGRPGLPVVTGEVHIARAAAHHAGHPWSATADLRVGGRQVVAVAEEATGTEVVDRLQGRLRRQTDKAAQAWTDGHRTAAPPWRGGSGQSGPAAGSGSAAEDSRTA
ncbi:hypothetical protein ACIO93_01480 [Streptomyces sp. NPDC087903]|uniref:hypothetical protein n=1 Tax=Streptomyces sp. NPDC087903 TaxID=3365819 RepID=UPI0037F3E965